MSSSRTIVKNSLFLYFRMVVLTGVGLYTTRILLRALGIDDFGLYSLVGGIVGIFSFLNGAMTAATQRFISIEIGLNNLRRIQETFNAALMSHMGIALIVLLLGQSIGLWFLNSKLNIPAERIVATNFIYQFSLASGLLSILQAPFNALILAHERMQIFAWLSLIDAALKLCAASLLTLMPYDKLQTYAVFILLASLLTTVLYVIYCFKSFKESHILFVLDKKLYKTLNSFVGWVIFGNLALATKTHGTNVLLNLIFGTAVNAAFGVMSQALNSATTFVNSFVTALNPQIYKSYSRGDNARMHRLMCAGAKLSYYLTLLVVAPVIIGIDYILELWLETPPKHTAIFIKLALINVLIDSISQPLITGAAATGNIKQYQIVVGSTLLLNLPLSFVALSISKDPSSFLYVSIAISLVALALRLLYLRKLIEFNVEAFSRSVIAPSIYISLITGSGIYAMHQKMGTPQTFFQLLVVCFLICSLVIGLIAFIGLDREERKFLSGLVSKKLNI